MARKPEHHETQNRLAHAIAARASNAHSAERFVSWPNVARQLLLRGLTEQECEAVMRSTWMRFAADADGSANHDGAVPAYAVTRYMDDPRNGCTPAAIASLVKETFGD